jgi:transposase InsO family protein
MPWKECVVNHVRQEFVELACLPRANVAALCRRFQISRRCGYKWLRRYQTDGVSGLMDRSRRPHASPGRVSRPMQRAVERLRLRHPVWGGRKLRKLLENQGHDPATLPAVSTIGRILFRGGMIDPARSCQHRAFARFEHEHPNDLWQMDFKGHFALGNGTRCHPLTVLDDHSRYCLCLRACTGESEQDVKPALVRLFQHYGLPRRILCDNGTPWGTSQMQPAATEPGRPRYTRLGLWLLLQDITVCHGRPRHPQTQGKEERLHRTLKEELLMRQTMRNQAEAQNHFDPWREQYNCVRPHEALGLAVPASRYGKSPREYQGHVKPQYLSSDQVRKVDHNGLFSFRSVDWRLGDAFKGQTVALCPTSVDGVMAVMYGKQTVAGVNLKKIGRSRRLVCCAPPPVATLPTAGHSTQKVLPMS